MFPSWFSRSERDVTSSDIGTLRFLGDLLLAVGRTNGEADSRGATGQMSASGDGAHPHVRRGRRWHRLAMPLFLAVIPVGLATKASASTPTVEVVHVATFGDILATPQGMPLYVLKTDHNGVSTCTMACLSAWPPLTVTSGVTPVLGAGIPGSLGLAVQTDGRNQVTYNGAPLYTFVGDTPGAVTGQGVQDFFVVEVQASPSSSTTTSSSTTAVPVPSSSTASTSTTETGGATSSGGASSNQAPANGSIPTAAVSSTSGGLPVTGPGPGLLDAGLAGVLLLLLGGAAALHAHRIEAGSSDHAPKAQSK